MAVARKRARRDVRVFIFAFLLKMKAMVSTDGDEATWTYCQGNKANAGYGMSWT